jgi:transcription antitermination factor NusG
MRRYKLDSNHIQWFAIKTKYKCEKHVCRDLSNKGVEAYIPLHEVIRIYKSKKRKLVLPIISGYVFVKINKDEYLTVLQTPFVFDFIRFGGEATSITQAEIDILKRFEGYDFKSSIEEFTYTSGEEVQIARGPLIGLKGKLIDQKGKRKYIVELQVFEKSLFVEVDSSHLEVIAAVT